MNPISSYTFSVKSNTISCYKLCEFLNSTLNSEGTFGIVKSEEDYNYVRKYTCKLYFNNIIKAANIKQQIQNEYDANDTDNIHITNIYPFK
jgi:hypothetical protein